MNPSTENIELTNPNPLVEIHLPDGRTFQGPRRTPIGTFLRKLTEWDRPPIMGAIVNGELRELTFPIEIESQVVPINMTQADGARIYRRSLTFLLEAAFEDLFPEADLAVDYAIASGGFYCEVIGRESLTRQEMASLETRMRELVKEDLPFEREQVPIRDAIEYFAFKGQTEKVRLLKYRQKDFLVMYKLRGRRDYHHGYMVPSTGFLRWFGILGMGKGFVLRFPRRHAPNELVPMPDSSKLLQTFQLYGDWLERLGIENTGALNDAIDGGRIREIILISEALHEKRIAEIARRVVEQAETARIILIAGPSSSGKTTFSKRLTVQLLAQGISPYPLELDNYFVDRERTPRDRNGDFDFESIEALDIEKISNDLHKLLNGVEVQLPKFNFKSGKSEPGEIIRLQPGQLVILEGIHGLNPKLLPGFPTSQTFRIYVSCLTQLNLDRHNRISTTDTRLLRRIVRDARERGYSAHQTIQRWESVKRGEKLHIFPYQDNADEMFNSALVYELAALRSAAEPLLRQVPFGSMEYIEAKRLLAFLQWFLPIDENLVPDNSLVREFIGGSILKDFKLWTS